MLEPIRTCRSGEIAVAYPSEFVSRNLAGPSHYRNELRRHALQILNARPFEHPLYPRIDIARLSFQPSVSLSLSISRSLALHQGEGKRAWCARMRVIISCAQFRARRVSSDVLRCHTSSARLAFDRRNFKPFNR
jgi:hypothetical protein